MNTGDERCPVAERSWHSMEDEDITRTGSRACSQEAPRRLTGEDVALTLPIPTSGLLTSPTKGARTSLVVSSSGPTPSIVESRFSLAALLTGGSCCSNTQAGTPVPSAAPPAASAETGQTTATGDVTGEALHNDSAATPDSSQVRRASAQPPLPAQPPPLPLPPAALQATTSVHSWPLPRQASTDVGYIAPSAEPSCAGTVEANSPSHLTAFDEPLLEEGPTVDDEDFCSAACSARFRASEQAGTAGDDGSGAGAVQCDGAVEGSSAALLEVLGAGPVASAVAAAPDAVTDSNEAVLVPEPADGAELEGETELQGVVGAAHEDGKLGEEAHDVTCDGDAADHSPAASTAAAGDDGDAVSIVQSLAASAAPAASTAPPTATSSLQTQPTAAAPVVGTTQGQWEQPSAPPAAVSTGASPQLSPQATSTSQALAAALSPRAGPGGGLDLDEEERVVEAAAAVLNLSLPLRTGATKRKACPASPAGSARLQQQRVLSSPVGSHAERGVAQVQVMPQPQPQPAPREEELEQVAPVGQQQRPSATELEDDSDAAFLALEAAAAAVAAPTATVAASTPPTKPVPYSPLRDSQPALFLRQSQSQHAGHHGLRHSAQHQQLQAALSPQPPGSAWRPLAPQEQEVMDTLQQLPAVIGSLSEEYQRYIRERALELTRIIDENLQRQGCGGVTAASGGAGASATAALGTADDAGAAAVTGSSPMSRWTSGAGGGVGLAAMPGATPSKEATAAAALLLTVAVNKTRWPYGSMGGAGGCASCGGAPQMTPPHAVKTAGLDFGGEGAAGDGARRPFLSPEMDIVTPLVLRPLSHEQGAAAAGGAGEARSSDLQRSAQAGPASAALPAASYSMCMGSALTNSRVAEPGAGHSPELTSGAFSIRGVGAAPADVGGGAGALPSNGTGMLERNCSGRERTPVSHPPAAAVAGAGAAGGEAVGGSACGSTAVSNSKPQHAPAGQQPHQQQYSILQKLQPHMAKLQQQQQRQQQLQAKAPPRGLGSGLGAGHGRGTGGGAGGKYAAPTVKATAAGKQAHQIPQFKGLGLELGSLPYLDTGSVAALAPKSARAHNNGTNRAGAGDLSARVLQPPLSARSRAGPNTNKPGYAVVAAAAHRADNLSEMEQKRRRILAAASAKARQPPAAGAAKAAGGTGSDGAPLSHRSRPTGYAAAAAAGLSTYQQLLRRVSGGGGGGAGAAPAQPAHQTQQHTGSSAVPAAGEMRAGGSSKASANGKAGPADVEAAHVEELLHGLVRGSYPGKLGDAPYAVVHAYPIMAAPPPLERRADAPEAPPASGGGAPGAAEPAPLHTAFKLQDLLPGLGAVRASATAPQPPPVTQAPPQQPLQLQAPAQARLEPEQATLQSGSPEGPVMAPAFSVAAVVGDGHHEPATGFVIVSRRATRELLPDAMDAASAGAGRSVGGSESNADTQQPPVASQLDLRSLLPPPAWQRASRATTPERLHPQPLQGPEHDAEAAQQQQQQQAAGQAIPASMTGRSVFAGAGGANAANLAASGRRWQLDADRCDADPLIVPDKEQIQHSSPVRPRYTSAADSHASPLTCGQQQHQAGLCAQMQQPGPAGARGVGGQLLVKPPASTQQQQQQQQPGGIAKQAGRPARGHSAGPRPWGAGNGGAKRTGSAAATKAGAGAAGKAARSRSAPRAHPGAVSQVQPVARQQQAPGTPCRAPSSPPPPMQSCTPAHLQRCSAAVDYAGSPCHPMPTAAAVVSTGHASPPLLNHVDGLGGGLAGAVGSSPRTPTNRRLHVTSPEDMPLSAAAQHIQARLAAADAAGRSTGGGSGSVLIVTAGSTVAPPPQAVPPPPAAVVASSLMGAASYRAAGALPHKPRSTPAAITPQQLRGGACTAAAAGAVAGGRANFTGFNSSTTTAPGLAAAAAAMSPPVWRPAASAVATAAAVFRATGSPGAEECVSPGGQRRDASPSPRGLGHDATPNILSPPRNYDRPWAAGMAGTGTPPREPAAVAASPAAATQHRLHHGHHTPTKARGPAAATSAPPPAAQHVAATGSRLQHVSGRASSVADANAPESLRTSAAEPDYARLGAMVSPSSSIQQSVKLAAAAQQHDHQQQQQATGAAKAASGRAVLSPWLSKDSTTSLRASGATSAAAAAVSAGAVQADGPTSRAAAAAGVASACAGGSYTNKMLARQIASQQRASEYSSGRGGFVGTALAAHPSGPAPDLPEGVEDLAEAGQEGADEGRDMDEAALEEEERRLTLEVGLLPPPLPTAAPAVPMVVGVREARNRNGSRSAVAASAPRASAAASWRGGASGLGSLAASLAAGSAASDGRVRALLAQAAWPGLQQPLVEDALVTLATGIAVLDPFASTNRVTSGAEQQRAADGAGGGCSPTAIPMGCFAIFRRGHHGAGRSSAAAAAKALPPTVASAAAPTSAQPVLLRVQVGEDGAVQLAIMRPRRSAAPGAGFGAGTPAEQRVRVAALTGMQPSLPVTPQALSPLLSASASSSASLSSTPGTAAGAAAAATAGAAAAAAADDADPASRWLQLVCTDGGLLRLSACSPADHARLVLGLNAAMALVGGVAAADAPLEEVALRGLGAAAQVPSTAAS